MPTLIDAMIAALRQHARQIEADTTGAVELHYSPARVEIYHRRRLGSRPVIEDKPD